MADYQKMYYILCRAADKALDVLPESPENKDVRALLQQALDQAEEMYINAAED